MPTRTVHAGAQERRLVSETLSQLMSLRQAGLISQDQLQRIVDGFRHEPLWRKCFTTPVRAIRKYGWLVLRTKRSDAPPTCRPIATDHSIPSLPIT